MSLKNIFIFSLFGLVGSVVHAQTFVLDLKPASQCGFVARADSSDIEVLNAFQASAQFENFKTFEDGLTPAQKQQIRLSAFYYILTQGHFQGAPENLYEAVALLESRGAELWLERWAYLGMQYDVVLTLKEKSVNSLIFEGGTDNVKFIQEDSFIFCAD